jgi:cytochrome c biogenesis factor
MNIDVAAGRLGLLAMINPMVGWIWGAAAVMALGSLITLVPSRARALAVRAEATAGAPTGRAVAEG